MDKKLLALLVAVTLAGLFCFLSFGTSQGAVPI
jgi:hypothetical protein